MKHPTYPNIYQAVLIICGLIILQVLIGIILYDFGYRFDAGDPGATGAVMFLASGIVISLLMHFQKINYKNLFHGASSSVSGMLVVLVVPIFLASIGLYILLTQLEAAITAFYPISEHDIEMYQRLFSGGFVSIITICIIAPLVEEIIFRGIFLRSFLNQHNVYKAILFSAFVFAIAHLDFHQIPSAFFYGCLLAWLYVMSRSLWPSILCHSLINSIAIVDYHVFYNPQETGKTDFLPISVFLLGIAMLIAGVILINRLLSPTTNKQ